MRTVSRLGDDDLAALAALVHRVVAADGGRLAVEWPALREGEAAAVLAGPAEALTGAVVLHGSGSAVELVGAVDPAARRRGLGTALLDAALERCRSVEQVLLVVPQGSPGGRALALRRGGVLDHSEATLLLDQPPPDAPDDPRTVLRPALPRDAAAVTALLQEAFAVARPRDGAGTLVVEHDGTVVGTLRAVRDGATVSLYAFAVAAALRGRGTGREVLRRVCRRAFADGAEQVSLEVATDNAAALGLYTSTGFRVVSSEDYYRLA